MEEDQEDQSANSTVRKILVIGDTKVGKIFNSFPIYGSKRNKRLFTNNRRRLQDKNYKFYGT